MDLKALIQKHSLSGPRYTSYPTAPQWNETVDSGVYSRRLAEVVAADRSPLACYVHVPFCEALCYYCGCNIQITKNKARGKDYVDHLVREMGLVSERLQGRRRLAQISWGGGTPTFLSEDQMERLYRGILDNFDLETDAEVSIEVDPRVTTAGQLELLSRLGFNRISLGVQDFNPEVQKAVNRVQPAEMTAETLSTARRLGFRGVNFDLMYGLPFQTLTTFEHTIDQVMQIRPDRIALYNYARLPTMIPHQKILEKFPMPDADTRVDIFLSAYSALTKAGYKAIGMDHFALETDELYTSSRTGQLYRNFMGYTVKKGGGMFGFGASAIGEIAGAFFQNVRETLAYEKKVSEGSLATFRGCLLTSDDEQRKWIIQSLMCGFQLSEASFAARFGHSLAEGFAPELSRLTPFFEEGILEGSTSDMRVTELGRLFVRNVAMNFDAYLTAGHKPVTYSKTV